MTHVHVPSYALVRPEPTPTSPLSRAVSQVGPNFPAAMSWLVESWVSA
jgi:hypothetical protein